MMTDPLADMLTRIRNGNRIHRPAVDIPATKLKAAVAQVLKDEGFVTDYAVGLVTPDEHGVPTFKPESNWATPKLVLRVFLKYGPDDEQVIRRIDRGTNGAGLSCRPTPSAGCDSPRARLRPDRRRARPAPPPCGHSGAPHRPSAAGHEPPETRVRGRTPRRPPR